MFVFFFKQKTAYEMRISDWSSDVCSSDLERIHHLFLHTATFSANALQIARKRPKLTRREFEAGLRAEDLLAERNLAASAVLDAIRHHRCPVTALRAQRDDGGASIGNKLLSSALRVCSNAIQKDGAITPALSMDAE